MHNVWPKILAGALIWPDVWVTASPRKSSLKKTLLNSLPSQEHLWHHTPAAVCANVVRMRPCPQHKQWEAHGFPHESKNVFEHETAQNTGEGPLYVKQMRVQQFTGRQLFTTLHKDRNSPANNHCAQKTQNLHKLTSTARIQSKKKEKEEDMVRKATLKVTRSQVRTQKQKQQSINE